MYFKTKKAGNFFCQPQEYSESVLPLTYEPCFLEKPWNNSVADNIQGKN